MKHTVVVWKVHCPKDGAQMLAGSGLHLYIRTGLSSHVVTYFCPECRQQRYQLVDKKVANTLTTEMGIGYTVLRVPLEALETHYHGPITEKVIADAVASMEREDWPKL